MVSARSKVDVGVVLIVELLLPGTGSVPFAFAMDAVLESAPVAVLATATFTSTVPV